MLEPTAIVLQDTTAKISDPVKRADAMMHQGDLKGAYPLYRQAADAGNAHAQMRLGVYFLHGIVLAKDCGEALRRFHAGDAAGDPQAAHEIALTYDNGWCVNEDDALAIQWFRKGAAQGDTRSMTILGLDYCRGEDHLTKDVAECKRWLLKASELGESNAMVALGSFYALSDSFGQPNYAEGRKWLEQAATRGDASAFADLGVLSEKGFGVPRDLDQALVFYRQAATLGDADAKVKVASFAAAGYRSTGSSARSKVSFDLSGIWQSYYDMPGLPKTIKVVDVGDHLSAVVVNTQDLQPKGIKFFEGTVDSTSRQGQVRIADYGLAQMVGKAVYSETPGEPKGWNPGVIKLIDPDHFQLGDKPPFQRASDPAVLDLPCDRQNSYHVQADYAYPRGLAAQRLPQYEVAACWYSIGANGGSIRSMTEYGLLLNGGLGVAVNKQEGLSWLEKGAAHGDFYAAESLAALYRRGDGVPQDAARAEAWDIKAKQLRDQLAKVKLEEERHEAQAAADERLLTGVVQVGGQMLINALTRPSACDAKPHEWRTNDTSMNNSFEMEEKARLTKEGACKARPVDVTPLLPASVVPQ